MIWEVGQDNFMNDVQALDEKTSLLIAIQKVTDESVSSHDEL